MTTTPRNRPTVAEELVRVSTQRYTDKHAEIVRRLREMADAVERIAPTKADTLGTPRYTAAAQEILHRFAWDLANIGAHYLVGEAGRADVAEATLAAERRADRPQPESETP